MSVTLTDAEREALRRRLANWSKSDGRVGAMLQRDVVPEVEAIVNARLESMTREARLSREATENAIEERISRHELIRALRAADAPEDSMATDDDLLRYTGRAEAVEIVRDMLGWNGA